MPAGRACDGLYRSLADCRLEEALAVLGRDPGCLRASRVGALAERLDHRARQLREAGEIGTWRRTRRHAFALRALLAHGPRPRRMIRDVELSPDYDGKFLLVKLAGGLPDGKLCLRGDDEWHQEILRNTAAEIRDLGFSGVAVLPLGGGYLRMENGERLRLWGASDAFGRCDMALVAKLLGDAFPQSDIRVED